MSVLVLRLAGPMQAWGSGSRFAHRDTETAPTKSGVIGMLAAAKGIRRTEPLTELLGLRFGVRVDQPGQLMRDFQTAHSLDGAKAMPLTYRFYLADAVFVAALSGDPELLHGLHDAVRRPFFPLYLGRRSCPPAGKVSYGVHDGELEEVLQTFPWQASEWFQKSSAKDLLLEMVRDAGPQDTVTETVADEPISFDPSRRRHGWRRIVRGHVSMANENGKDYGHNPMSLLGG